MKDYTETYKLNECGLEILSETQLEDTEPETPDMDGYSVMIHIMNVRLNRAAINAYFDAKCRNDRFCYETHQEYLDHVAEMNARMELWEKKMQELAGITVRAEEGFTITQNISEFFTIVYMENLKEYGRKKEEADTATEDKAGFVQAIGKALHRKVPRTGVTGIEYVSDGTEEFAVITFDGGSQKCVCVTADSCLAMLNDVYRALE